MTGFSKGFAAGGALGVLAMMAGVPMRLITISDGDAMVVGAIGLALVVTPLAICLMWLDLSRRINRITGDPRKVFE
jgi:hypothetical protein